MLRRIARCALLLIAFAVPATPASAAPATHSVSVSTTGQGTVTSAPAGINCPGTCSASFTENTFADLTATPSVGYRFSRWSNGCSVNPCPLYMDQDHTVTAIFAV